MSSLTDEILRLIAGNRNFRKNYTVVRNLINNPKAPLDVTMHMLPMLNAVDLKRLTTNKNVPEDRKSTRLNSSHLVISYAVFCLKKKKKLHKYIQHVYYTTYIK